LLAQNAVRVGAQQMAVPASYTFLTKRERWTLKNSADERVYLVNHWMDLDGCICKSYLFHEGFLLVLFDSGDIKCMQSYKSNTKEQLTNVV
jgi:hypothetical protein